MTTCRDERLRPGAQCPEGLPHRSHARTAHAPVIRPLLLWSLVQVGAVTGCLVIGIPLPVAIGVVVAVAVLTAVVSRRTVTSLLAGAGLRVAQPFGRGEQVRVYVPSLRSVQDAEILRVGPANTTLLTASGIVLVPNADMLRGARA